MSKIEIPALRSQSWFGRQDKMGFAASARRRIHPRAHAG
jgi:hypothetical protein